MMYFMRIVPFNQWTKLGQWWPTMRLKGEMGGIIVHHSVTKPTDNAAADARVVERIIYNRRFKSRFSMVAYSWLIHPDGSIFEGRGHLWRNGANTNKKGGSLSNSNTVSVCMIGDYRTDKITDVQRSAFWWLVQHLQGTGTVKPNPDIFPHSDLAWTACPSGAMDGLNQPLPEEEEDDMITCIDKLTNDAWVCSGTKARPLSDVTQWLATWEGPIRRANNMKHVIDDLYEVV